MPLTPEKISKPRFYFLRMYVIFGVVFSYLIQSFYLLIYHSLGSYYSPVPFGDGSLIARYYSYQSWEDITTTVASVGSVVLLGLLTFIVTWYVVKKTT